MSPSLRPRHAGRYAAIGSLLVKHRAGVTDAGDAATAEDAERLVDSLEEMGPTFVKLGQLLSTRSDLLPPVYLDALTRLQDDVAPFPFAEVERIVEAEIGARMSSAFQSFHDQPLAAASLGQVHKAVLRDGREVAVKVQRPGIRERVVEEMEVVEELAAFVDQHTRTGERLQFSEMVAEFRRSLMNELDYRKEADNLRLLAENLQDEQLIVVPCPVEGYTTETVLTMELVEGRNVGSIGPLGLMEIEGRPLAEALFRSYLDQILVHGFVHADPHPGNVLVTSDGRLALIDLGMVVHVPNELRDQLLRLLASVSEGRAREASDLLVSMGEQTPDFDPDRFRQDIERLVVDNSRSTAEQIEAGRVVGEMARASAAAGLRPPAVMTMVGKALLNLDQVARTLDPQFDPNDEIRRHTASVLQRRLIDGASPGRLLNAALDAKELAETLPARVNKVMDALSQGQLTVKVDAIDEAELMRGIQKLANRVTTGVVVAALIIGAAMLMRIETDAELFGYPALAIVLFLLASVSGLWLVITSLVNDLPQVRRRRRR